MKPLAKCMPHFFPILAHGEEDIQLQPLVTQGLQVLSVCAVALKAQTVPMIYVDVSMVALDRPAFNFCP